MKKTIALLLFVALTLCACGRIGPAGQTSAEPQQEEVQNQPEQTEQADLLDSLTLRQKVGQMFLVRPDALDLTQTQEQINDAYAQGVTEVTDDLLGALEAYPVGGIAVFGKNIQSPDQLRQFTADWSAAGDIPMFLAVDEEGGRVARLANAEGFDLPRYESAAAAEDAGEMGRTIGGYLRDYGFNMDFAPVADVNSNPDNPVIGTRAFSGDPEQVRRQADAMAQGLLEQGVLPVYKHFPGHGDTAEDSHEQLAVTHKTADQLRALEWIPYQGRMLPAVMVGHIGAPEAGLDGPASLSRTAVTDWLRTELGHEGLVITDSMAMDAIAAAYTPDEAAIQAIEAGVDIVLMPNGLQQAFDGVVQAVESGRIPESRIDESVRRILQAKRQLGLL